MNADAEVKERAGRITLLILDVDGVLTDGRIIYTDEGRELKFFHVRDGHGIKMVQRVGIEVALISGRASAAVTARARDLEISCVYQGVRDKVEALEQLQDALAVPREHIATVGDDLVDLPLMTRVGLAVAVTDAPIEVQEAAHWVTTLPGGRGAVREVCELLLQARGLWQSLVADFSR